MKIIFAMAAFTAMSVSCQHTAQTSTTDASTGKASQSANHKPASPNLYIDVHQLGPGKVNYEAVAEAHAKDLATQGKYDVRFLKYWVDEAKGTVYCLSSSSDTASIRKTHAEAHGLLPNQIYPVTAGIEAAANGGNDFFLDVHELGEGKVTAKDVAGAHEKDLAVQQKYGVKFINYWVNEKEGRVVCLSQAADSTAIIKTHQEAHGLIPSYIEKVKQGE